MRATPDAGLTAANQKRLGHLGVAPLTGPQVLAEHYKSSFSGFFFFFVQMSRYELIRAEPHFHSKGAARTVIMWALSIKTNGVARTEIRARRKV